MFVNEKVDNFLNEIKNLCTNEVTVTPVPAKDWEPDKIVISKNGNEIEIKFFSSFEMKKLNEQLKQLPRNETFDVAGYIVIKGDLFNFTLKDDVFKTMKFAGNFPPTELVGERISGKFANEYFQSSMGGTTNFRRSDEKHTMQDLISSL